MITKSYVLACTGKFRRLYKENGICFLNSNGKIHQLTDEVFKMMEQVISGDGNIDTKINSIDDVLQTEYTEHTFANGGKNKYDERKQEFLKKYKDLLLQYQDVVKGIFE